MHAMLMSQFLMFYLFLELQDFLRCITSVPYCHPSQKISVAFTAGEDAFLISTCGRQLTISQNILSEEVFAAGLRAVLKGNDFTMC